MVRTCRRCASIGYCCCTGYVCCWNNLICGFVFLFCRLRSLFGDYIGIANRIGSTSGRRSIPLFCTKYIYKSDSQIDQHRAFDCDCKSIDTLIITTNALSSLSHHRFWYYFHFLGARYICDQCGRRSSGATRMRCNRWTRRMGKGIDRHIVLFYDRRLFD